MQQMELAINSLLTGPWPKSQGKLRSFNHWAAHPKTGQFNVHE
jgi:hypothetical protein